MYNTQTSTQQNVALDVGLRAHMLKVYNIMASGLGVSALTAYAVANTSLVGGFYAVDMHGRLHMTGLAWLCVFLPFALIFAMGVVRSRQMPAAVMYSFYWVFTACMGVSLSAILLNHHINTVQPFLAAVIAFSGLSIVGYTTNRDLTGLGSFCIMGLWGMIGMMVIGALTGFHISTMLTGIVGVIIFSGLTAFDTQKIKTNYLSTRDGSASGAIWDAINLYLDALNLFMSLVEIFNSES